MPAVTWLFKVGPDSLQGVAYRYQYMANMAWVILASRFLSNLTGFLIEHCGCRVLTPKAKKKKDKPGVLPLLVSYQCMEPAVGVRNGEEAWGSCLPSRWGPLPLRQTQRSLGCEMCVRNQHLWKKPEENEIRQRKKSVSCGSDKILIISSAESLGVKMARLHYPYWAEMPGSLPPA